MSNTAEDVFAVKFGTERGDVIRVYTFERISGAVWQVDMLAGDGVFWIHPKMTNPTPEYVLRFGRLPVAMAGCRGYQACMYGGYQGHLPSLLQLDAWRGAVRG